MGNRTSRSVFITICGLAILGSISIAMLARQASLHRTRTPFTAILTTFSYSGDGAQRDVRVDSESFRSDGSSVQIRNTYNFEPFGLRIIWDLNKRKRVVTDPTTKSVTTYRLSASEVAERQEYASCEGESAGELLAYAVIKKNGRSSGG